MSHFTRVRTALRDAGLLANALGAAGFPAVEVHDEPQTLFGYHGDARPERAEVIVRRAHLGEASNDLGFRRTTDGTFEAIISEYDRRQYDEAWLGTVSQHYAHAATLRYAAANGFEVATEQRDADGTLRLTLRRLT
ncbi:DUF1257 domain-containing protein [Dactylosporangium sucinum]|uniref:DUF1257 domain-containing protein n=1 Tax=Dactylosporangium sucinum TaxID=1424081 RepID=A0A917X0L9_9ACTN|nr:DUF1257 domain-containing protein [Dactylosporangium sucinum]GGM48019.1 hypothetical protein GCM10007977_057040 [Dactylosporangium sucinum]